MARGGKRVRQDIIDRLMDLSPAEQAEFFEELEAEKQKRAEKEQQPWPRVVKMYSHQSKETAWSNGEEIGLDMERIGQWCPLYEVEFHVEVQEDGDTKILAVDGFMIDYDRPYEGPLFRIRDHD